MLNNCEKGFIFEGIEFHEGDNIEGFMWNLKEGWLDDTFSGVIATISDSFNKIYVRTLDNRVVSLSRDGDTKNVLWLDRDRIVTCVRRVLAFGETDTMDIDIYTARRMEYEPPVEKGEDRIIQAAIGLCGESGEVIDIIKKAKFQGHTLNRNKVAEELGDVAWYLVMACSCIGLSLDQVLAMNIEKLSRRYPYGFREEDSVNRKE